MESRVGRRRSVALVGGIGLVAMLPAAPRGDATLQSLQEGRTGGSEIPCAAPLTWRIARVDDGFGMQAPRVAEVVEEATRLWERAVGLDLFIHDPENGFPVRVVFDRRQEEANARNETQTRLIEVADRIDVRQAELRDSQERFDARRRSLETRAEEYARRAAEHNARVGEWNAIGGAPADVARELAAAGRALDEERSALEEERSEVEATFGALEGEQRAVAAAVDQYNDAVEEIGGAAIVAAEAGEYREAVRRENGRVVSVGREIRLYRFTGSEELLLVAAHELGHALGLGHVADRTAVMSARHEGVPEPIRVHDGEAELLAALCTAGGAR